MKSDNSCITAIPIKFGDVIHYKDEKGNAIYVGKVTKIKLKANGICNFILRPLKLEDCL